MTLVNSTVLDPQVTNTDDGDDDDLTHVYCVICMPEATRAMCGKNLANDKDLGDYEGPEPDTCIVCAELIETHHCK